MLKHIHDIDTALMFYHVAGASIDKGKLNSHAIRLKKNILGLRGGVGNFFSAIWAASNFFLLF